MLVRGDGAYTAARQRYQGSERIRPRLHTRSSVIDISHELVERGSDEGADQSLKQARNAISWFWPRTPVF